MDAHATAAQTIDLARTAGAAPQPMTFHSGSRTFYVRPQEIEWAEAQGNYVRLYGRFGSCLVRATLTALHASLLADGFCRIHRSTLINVASVRELRRRRRTGWVVTLRDGTALPVTPRHRRALRRMLEHRLAAARERAQASTRPL